jgi:integrase
MDRDLRTYHMDRFKALDQKEIERLLYPLLRADDRPTFEQMLPAASVVNQPKPRASAKPVPVIRQLAEILDTYRSSIGDPQSGVMFHTGAGQHLDIDKLVLRDVRPVANSLDIDWYGLHGFRRGIASNLYELCADEKIVQRVLRHAKSHVTKDRYIKTFDPALVAAMKKLEATVDLVNQSAPRVHQIN